MSESEWLACEDPDGLLEELEGKVPHELLVYFVRQCWQRVAHYVPAETGAVTIVEEFAALAPKQSEHDAVVYASETALKAARWSPDVRAEQKQQAALLRRIAARPT